jgi:hypothetical protein
VSDVSTTTGEEFNAALILLVADQSGEPEVECAALARHSLWRLADPYDSTQTRCGLLAEVVKGARKLLHCKILLPCRNELFVAGGAEYPAILHSAESKTREA